MAYDISAKVKALREYHEQEKRNQQTKIIAPTVSYNQSLGGSDTCLWDDQLTKQP